MSRILITFVAILQFVYLCFAHESVLVSEIPHKYAQRPQEPLRPYPYDEEEVVFHNASDNVTLAGTLTRPRSSGPFPAVILLHGSGPYDRDYTSDGHKFFLVWADYLTRQGIAVLRFDKRSAGKSTGNYDTSTLENFAKDALAGVEYLKTRSDINPRQIGLIGHSEGGMTAFLAASKLEDIAFIISMAAPCVNLEELLYVQEPLLLRAERVAEESIVLLHELRSQIFAIVKEEPQGALAEKKLRDLMTNYFDSFTLPQREMAEFCYGPIEQQISLMNSAAWRYWLVYDPLPTLKKVKVPILALNGSLDFVVTPEQNLQLLAQALEEIDHKDFITIELPQLNHAFQTCKTGSLKEYEQIEETTSRLVLDIMTEWLWQKTYCKKG